MFYGFDFDELYNLETDIYQPTNLASDPVYDKILRKMARRIWKRIHETGDSHLDCLGSLYAPSHQDGDPLDG